MLVEKVARGACERHIRRVRRHDTDPATLEEMLPRAVDYAWREHADEARAAIEAVFDWLAEPGEAAISAGIVERHDQPVPEAWSLATVNIWTAMLAAMRKEAL